MIDYIPVGMYAQFFRVEGVHVKESWKVRSVEKYKSSSQYNLPYLKYSTVQALRNRNQSLTFYCFSSTLPYTHTYLFPTKQQPRPIHVTTLKAAHSASAHSQCHSPHQHYREHTPPACTLGLVRPIQTRP